MINKVVTAMFLGGLAVATVSGAFAQSPAPAMPPTQDGKPMQPGGMMGGQGGMMGSQGGQGGMQGMNMNEQMNTMMQQMTKMMENCNKMMEKEMNKKPG